MTSEREPLSRLLEREHRRLDELFGQFLAAEHVGDPAAARGAIAAFDQALREHTALEENLFPEAAGRKLAPHENEEAAERVFRELRLEHVQLREVSGMILRLLSEAEGLEGARRLAGNLARRWDAHTSREELEVFPVLDQSLDTERADRARKTLTS